MQIRDRIREFRRVKASELLPNPKNWRVHEKGQREGLQEILALIGYADALLVRETGNGLMLIDGHLRAETTPHQDVPVLVLDVDEKEADTLLATLDPLANMASVNELALQKLRAELKLKSEALNRELDRLARTPSNIVEDDAPEVPEVATTQLGDLWVLGDHRLLCGDCTDAEGVRRLLAGAQPRLLVTDPPYGVELDMEWRDRAGHNDWSPAERSYMRDKRGGNSISGDTIADWSPAYKLVPSLEVAYVWHATAHMLEVAQGLVGLGFQIRQQIIWVKTAFAMSRSAYHWQHEPCWYAVRKGKNAGWIGGHAESTIWQMASPKQLMGGSTETKEAHPTQKPVEAMARPIRNHSGDVFEPFSGSGTTLSAAQQIGRRCYGFEIEPRYCDVIVNRWETLTGKTAELERGKAA